MAQERATSILECVLEQLRMTNKELEIEGCRVFICPNLNEIDSKLLQNYPGITNEQIKACKDIAVEYLRKTYHKPRYSSIKPLLPAFVYIGLNIYYENGTRYYNIGTHGTHAITMREAATIFGIWEPSIRKWVKDVTAELNIVRKPIQKHYNYSAAEILNALNQFIDKYGDISTLTEIQKINPDLARAIIKNGGITKFHKALGINFDI